MVSEFLCIPEISIAQLTIGVIGHHVQLPLLCLIEVSAAEVALWMIGCHVGVQILSSICGELQREEAPPSLNIN